MLTGETGAGKSIIIDSINMILGSRGNKELVRHGTENADVQAVFTLNTELKSLLSENDIDFDDDNVIISRRITKDGKSTARINGTIVTLSLLRDIADRLINIHGQHDNQALLTPAKHIKFLDAYAKTETELQNYKLIYGKYLAAERELEDLMLNEQEKLQKTDLLSYQINEIDSAKLLPDEDKSLKEQLSLLENAEKINESADKAYACLYDSPDEMRHTIL